MYKDRLRCTSPTINLSGCAISDSGLINIAERSPLLASAKLSMCHKLTSESISALGLLCPKLRFVDIAGCIRVTTDGVTTLAFGSRHSLETIVLSGLPLLTDDALISLELCEQLVSVDIIACPQVTCAGIASLIPIKS